MENPRSKTAYVSPSPLRRLLGTGNHCASDSVQDIFAQVKIPQVAQGGLLWQMAFIQQPSLGTTT